MGVIEDNPRMFTIAKDALMDRVYPNLSHQSCDSGSVEGRKANELEDLILPWNEKHWNIFVTSVSSTVDIWGRLIGADYSVSQFFISLNRFKQRKKDSKVKKKKISKGHLYSKQACSSSQC